MRNLGRGLIALAVLICLLDAARADGKFFGNPESVPPDLPYQRAFLHISGDRETLLLQSKYRGPDGTVPEPFAWVVPVPSVPEIGSLPPLDADDVFRGLESECRPDVVDVGARVFAAVLLLLALGLAYRLHLGDRSALPLFADRPGERTRARWLALGLAILVVAGTVASMWVPDHRAVAFDALNIVFALLALVGLPLSVIGWIVSLALRPMRRGLRAALGSAVVWSLVALVLLIGVWGVGFGSEGVEVLSHERVGVYEAFVVRGDDGADLVGWLAENGLRPGDADRPVIDDYVARGWCFVAARIDPTRVDPERPDREPSGPDGLVAPLVLRFRTERPVYPLALTGAAGKETEVLLYVLAAHRMTGGGLLRTEAAGLVAPLDVADRSPPWKWWIRKRAMPEGLLADEPFAERWLTKLKGRLMPTDMTEDLHLVPAEEDERVRELRRI